MFHPDGARAADRYPPYGPHAAPFLVPVAFNPMRILVSGSLGRWCAVVLATATLAACKDGTGPAKSKAPVASVTVTGAPASYLVLGKTVQLSATPRDAAGNTVNSAVTWSSSDSLLARVSTSGLVTALAPGNVTINAQADGISGFASFAVVLPVSSVLVASPAEALYVSQAVQLAVTPRDSLGRVLTGRSAAWSTSDAQKASVDAQGKVTALGAGSVTITADCEGKLASVTLTLLARPVADWSQVGDWATYQGNAQHTGFVAGTLDPVSFHSLWSTSPAGGTALNPVTAAAGKVFVSTVAYFGQQMVAVLDAQTGAQKWARDLGPIHGVHPPAYDNGRMYVTTSGHQDSFLWAFDAETGAVQFRTAYLNQWSRYYAPTVVNGTVYMAGGYYDGMYAFNAADGGQRWFVNLNQYDQWTPSVSDGLVYAYTGVYSPELTVADAATGTVAYNIPDPHFNWNGYSMDVAPVLASPSQVVATQNRRLVSFDLPGRRIGWEQTASYYGNVTVANDVLYVFNNNQLEARRASDGGLLWVWVPPSGAPVGTTIATRNLLFISTASTTYVLDLASRKVTWSYPAGGSLALSKDGILFIAQSNGALAAIAVK